MENKLLLKGYEYIIYFSAKNRVYIYLLLFLEFISIFVEIINSCYKIVTVNYNTEPSMLLINLKYISFYYYLKQVNTCSNNPCFLPDYLFYIIIGFVIIIFLLFLMIIKMDERINYNKKDSKKTISSPKLILNFLIVNSLDILFHIMGLFVIYMSINKLIDSIVNQNYINLIISLIILVIFLYSYFIYVLYVNIIIQFSYISFHYDYKFSKDYDLLLIILKVIISVENNIVQFAVNHDSKILYVNIIIILTLCFYFMKILINLYKKEVLFIVNLKYNIFRLALIIFTFFASIIYLCLVDNLENGVYKISEIFLYIISNLVITLYFVIWFNDNYETIMFNNDNKIYHLIYVLTEKFNKSNLEIEKLINVILIRHKSSCQAYPNDKKDEFSCCKLCLCNEKLF